MIAAMTNISALHSTRHRHDQTLVELSAACEESFCRQIARRTGIVLQDHQLSNLRDTVRNGCARFGYADAAQYLHALQASEGLTAPLEYLIAGITVGESYFFRDSEQIELLRGELLPGIIAAKRAEGNLSLRIWSAGCSQGQEIYTIALMLHELLPDIGNWRIHLLGTDINSEAVAQAIRGRYSNWSFRAMPPELREHWFTHIGSAYEIHPQIRQMVHFAYLNLTEDVYPSILSETNAMDVILCRNVFIYLDRQAIQRSMAQYAECLLEQGVLILGASDPVEYAHTRLSWIQAGRTAYFRKEPPKVSVAQPRQHAATIPPVPMGKSQWQASPIRMPEPAKPVVPKQPDKPGSGREAIIKLLKGSEWTVALARIEESFRDGEENSDLWQMKAKALASLGLTEKALQACENSLRLAHDNKHAYLIQGLILAELDREQEAEQALRKALYLDHSFLEAHYELGMLRVRASDLRGGVKSLENALKLASAGEPERELHNAGGMTYRRFAQVLQNEISMLKELAADRKHRSR